MSTDHFSGDSSCQTLSATAVFNRFANQAPSNHTIGNGLWNRPCGLKRWPLLHARVVGGKHWISGADIKISPAHGEVAGHGRGRNVSQREAVTDNEFPVCQQAFHFPEAAVYFASLPRHPISALHRPVTEPLEKHQHKGIANAIAQHFEALGEQPPRIIGGHQRRHRVGPLDVFHDEVRFIDRLTLRPDQDWQFLERVELRRPGRLIPWHFRDQVERNILFDKPRLWVHG